jgi:hypothetical protein
LPVAIAWDQTLVSLGLALLVGWVVYRRAAHGLRRQEVLRELRLRRDALDQVLAALQGPVLEYLEGATEDYPQREMVELERRALQAQILFWRDLSMQQALRDLTYAGPHAAAAETLRRILSDLDAQLGVAGTGS